MSSAGDANAERRRRGPAKRRWWLRHPLSACVRVLRGELYPERNRYRDVVILILVGVVTWAVFTASDATSTAHRAIAQVQEGRSTSIGVICAVESGLGEAGKETIVAGSVLPPQLQAFLQRHGYPPVRVRQLAARQAARAYVTAIGAHIARELRQRGKSARLVPKLLRRDGTINCRELQRIAHVQVR